MSLETDIIQLRRLKMFKHLALSCWPKCHFCSGYRRHDHKRQGELVCHIRVSEDVPDAKISQCWICQKWNRPEGL